MAMAKKAEFLSNKPLGEDLFDGQDLVGHLPKIF